MRKTNLIIVAMGLLLFVILAVAMQLTIRHIDPVRWVQDIKKEVRKQYPEARVTLHPPLSEIEDQGKPRTRGIRIDVVLPDRLFQDPVQLETELGAVARSLSGGEYMASSEFVERITYVLAVAHPEGDPEQSRTRRIPMEELGRFQRPSTLPRYLQERLRDRTRPPEAPPATAPAGEEPALEDAER